MAKARVYILVASGFCSVVNLHLVHTMLLGFLNNFFEIIIILHYFSPFLSFFHSSPTPASREGASLSQIMASFFFLLVLLI